MRLHADIGTGQPGQFFHLDPECARTLDTMHDAHFVLCYENHGQDSRVRPITVCPVISQKAGTGGNNLPLVLHSKGVSDA